jgi:hypothetical protein
LTAVQKVAVRDRRRSRVPRLELVARADAVGQDATAQSAGAGAGAGVLGGRTLLPGEQFRSVRIVPPRKVRFVGPPADATGGRSVVVAGSDPVRRATVLDELAQTMSPGTAFEQATDLSRLLELAPASRMVVLSGDLGGEAAGSALHKLAQRHPGLPVIRLDS